jgi:hypothetical protein
MVDEFVTIATFADVAEAALARARLEADGIRCHVENGHLAWTYPVRGGRAIRVPKSEAERALAILKAPQEDAADKLPNSEDGPSCPQCQKQYAYAEDAPWSVILSALTMGRVAVRRQLRCTSCGHVWSEPKPLPAAGPYRSG